MTFDLFMIWSNLCPSCCCNTGRSCMAFADMQWLFLSGEGIVAHGPLVISSVSSLSFLFLFLPCPCLSSPLLSLLSFFSLSLGNDTKWTTRVYMSLNPNTIKKKNLTFYWVKDCLAEVLSNCKEPSVHSFHQSLHQSQKHAKLWKWTVTSEFSYPS